MLAPLNHMPKKSPKKGEPDLDADFIGDSEGRYKPEFVTRLTAAIAAFEADKSRGIPLEQVAKELGLDNNN